MKKAINPEAVEIQRRFFQALDMAISLGKVGSLTAFCDDHKLNRTKYSRIRSTIDKPMEERLYKIIDIDALSSICRDFGVSADWLLTGRGKMLVRAEKNAK
ncbi:MAG: hypothetical protein II465_01470 [Bacteroidales bacterium]|nr:hypothetical protein [Bacteroidales bacterium]